MTRDMLLRALRNVTDDEARAIYEALDQYVENEVCDSQVESDDPHDVKPLLAPAETALDRMNAERAALVELPVSNEAAAKPNKAQFAVLESAVYKGGRTHSGRNGWNTNTLRAMARRGWMRLVKAHTWETDWEITEAGRAAYAAMKGT